MPSAPARRSSTFLVRRIGDAAAEGPGIGLCAEAGCRAAIPGDAGGSAPLVVEFVADTAGNSPAITIEQVERGDEGRTALYARNGFRTDGAEIDGLEPAPVRPFDRSEGQPVRRDAGLHLEFNALRHGGISEDRCKATEDARRGSVGGKIKVRESGQVDGASQAIEIDRGIVDQACAERDLGDFVGRADAPANAFIRRVRRRPTPSTERGSPAVGTATRRSLKPSTS